MDGWMYVWMDGWKNEFIDDVIKTPTKSKQ